MEQKYNYVRTHLTASDRKDLKRIARSKGYTMPGYITKICKEAVSIELKKEAENEGQRVSE